MRLALTELWRRPGRFAIATGALTLLVILLLVLGALLDGLFLNSTGALRSVGGDAIVFTEDANESLLRSRITPGLRADVERVEGVEGSGGLGVTLVGSHADGSSELLDTAVVGYQREGDGVPAPAGPGRAWADTSLKADGVREGSVLLAGPGEIPLEVVGFVDDTNYLLQGALWVDGATWREVQNSARPDTPFSEGDWQVLTIDLAAGDVPDQVDAATDVTTTLTIDGAIDALPGIPEQNRTFNSVIGATFFVAGLVVALFFALLTLERVALYGVMKAVGTPSSRLAYGLVAQAGAVAVVAFATGGLLSFGLVQVLPDEVPAQLEPSRAAWVAVGVVLTALVGSLVSLRRVLRVDPASAVGRES